MKHNLAMETIRTQNRIELNEYQMSFGQKPNENGVIKLLTMPHIHARRTAMHCKIRASVHP